MRPADISTPLRCWPALLLTPLLALGMQSLAYSLVTPSCARQSVVALHAVAAAALLLALALTALAGLAWRRAAEVAQKDGEARTDREGPRDLFLGRTATLVGAFSSLTIVALWIPMWLLSPCT
jgi:small-conductance mechanosensitive channel